MKILFWKNLFDYIYKYRIILCFILFITLVLFKLHGSSIGIYNYYVQPGSNPSIYTKPILGHVRPIRSDEFAISTPITLSQSYVDYSMYNNITRAEKTNVAILYNSPIKALFEIVKPFYWGYLLFGTEHGISWYWNGKMIFLFLVTFEFFQIITRKNRLISLLGAFLIVYSPPVQWWFNTDLIEELFWSELGIITLYYFLYTQKHIIKLLLSLAMGLCIGGFALCLYPAFQVPFTYTFLIIALWVIFNNKFIFSKKDIIYPIISIVLASIIIASLILPSVDVIEIIKNTVHPGQRRYLGGGNIFSLFYYLINYEVLPNNNRCELSHFNGLFPLTEIITVIYLFKTKFKDKLCLSLLFLQVLIVLYLTVGLGEWFAKLTGFIYTTQRAAIISSYIDIVILLKLLSTEEKFKINNKYIISLIYSLIVFVIVTIIKQDTMANTEDINITNWTYLYPYFIAIIAFFMSLLLINMIQTNSKIKTFWAIIVMGLSFGCYWLVNPVSKGLDTVYKIPVGKVMQNIQKEHPGRWIVINEFPLTNFPIIFGIPTINSTNTYPNLNLWYKLDSDKKYENIYNRYANITTFLIYEKYKSHFELFLDESIIIYLSIVDLPKLGVDYIFSTRIDKDYYKTQTGIELIQIYKNNFAYIYKVNYYGDALKIYQDYNKNLI